MAARCERQTVTPSPKTAHLARRAVGTVPAREGTSTPSTSRRSWRSANLARRRQGRQRAVAMFALRLGRVSVGAIAATFGTSRGSVYTRLHRLRVGFYTP